jgi:dehydrogenase/reductase SDR family member 12
MHLMVKLLAPKMSKVGKVIVVSSGGMLTQTLRLEDFNYDRDTFDGTKQYAIAKRQQVALAEYYSKKYSPLPFYSMHPGWCDTPGVRTSMPSFF